MNTLDTGKYNDNIMGYVEIALHRAGISPYEKKVILGKLSEALDDYTADEALNVYRNGLPSWEK